MSDKWMTIDSAPKDGTWILLCGGRTTEDDYADVGVDVSRPVVGFYDPPAFEGDAEWAFCFWDGAWREGYESPTHWMPLPPAPEEDSKHG